MQVLNYDPRVAAAEQDIRDLTWATDIGLASSLAIITGYAQSAGVCTREDYSNQLSGIMGALVDETDNLDMEILMATDSDSEMDALITNSTDSVNDWLDVIR
ncbi:hypothetical protein L916_06963 [Phytophthora nicotianae]|nr:hypothetical protein L916_06963 [Phytophthora nicotianae]